MDRLTVASYAKLNYTLDVRVPRPDGYHEIASVVQVVSLADEIEMVPRRRRGVSVECDAPGVPSGSRNLVWKAVDAALRRSGCRAGVEIVLRKRIPAQAGLGGGSSNAAYALLGVDRLMDLGMSSSDMRPIAASLGSDVPLFLTGGLSRMSGRGENVIPLPDGPPIWFVIVKPRCGVSTAAAYAALDAVTDRQSADATPRVLSILASGPADRLVDAMANDFEAVVPEIEPTIAAAMDDLLMARAANARLCGSGSAVFGVAHERAAAEETARILRLKYDSVFVCHTLTREESLDLGATS